MSKSTRRDLLVGAASLGAATTFPAPALLRAQDAHTAKWATSTPGLTVAFYDYIRDNKLDEKHGLRFPAPILNPSITALYKEFVDGTYDLIVGSWDPFVARHNAGAPCQLLCTLMTADMIGLIATANGPRTIAELKGKTIAAPKQSGVYRMTRAFIKELDGLDLETGAQVENADRPGLGVMQMIADRADAALAWEPLISSGMLLRPDLEVIYGAGRSFRDKTALDLPYFCIHVRKDLLDRTPGLSKKLNAMFADCVAGMEANFDQVADKYAARVRVYPSALKAARNAGRLRFKYGAASDPATQKTINAACDILVRQGVLTKPASPGFFAA
jgi:NitT/TauT family transport system substrate-binding protein